MRDRALINAIKKAGGPAALGQALGISSQAISQWERCPADRVISVEKATGGKVTRSALRPDLYPPEEAEAAEEESAETHTKRLAGKAA